MTRFSSNDQSKVDTEEGMRLFRHREIIHYEIMTKVYCTDFNRHEIIPNQHPWKKIKNRKMHVLR